jgi:phosphoserine aminotransferase
MISFYPGPSKVYEETPRYVKEAYKEGILSINHRSDEFVNISKTTISLLKEKLRIPKNYTIFFTSSATECWEIIAQSFITDYSFHLYNGAFGQKWFDYTKRLHPNATPIPFDVNESIGPAHLQHIVKYSIICLTQNETSNGTQVVNAIIKKIRKQHEGSLIAVDATSSMAGIKLDFKNADIWFASVQKCFGLPAGLGIMVCSPRALQKANEIGDKKHYNSMTFMMAMMEKWQTPYTPNVLSIYLLMRVLQAADTIDDTERRIIRQYKDWSKFLKERTALQHFVTNEKVHSYTVLPVKADADTLVAIKKKAKSKGILLGEGYGDFKPFTFRIANFPAINEKEIRTLKKFLKNY